MISQQKIYVLVLFFVTFALLGHLAEQALCTGIFRPFRPPRGYASRGILKGPFSISSGLGGLLMAVLTGPLPEGQAPATMTGYIYGLDTFWLDTPGLRITMLLVLGAVCFVLFYGSALLVKLISGRTFWSLNPLYPLIAWAVSLIGLFHVRPVLLLLAKSLPGPAILLFILLTLIPMFTQTVDAVAAMRGLRSEGPMGSMRPAGTGEAATEKTAGSSEQTADMKLINRWREAYPRLR